MEVGTASGFSGRPERNSAADTGLSSMREILGLLGKNPLSALGSEIGK
jgi:hypothetical protein